MLNFDASATTSDSSHPMTAFEAIAAKKDVTIPASIITCGAVMLSTLESMIQNHLEAFTVFGSLPKELQLKIWGMAANDLPGRAIYANEVEEEVTTESSGDPQLTPAKFEVIGSTRPSMFGVCKESDEIAAILGYKLLFQVCGNKKAVFFHPVRDCLEIHSELLFNVGQPGQLSFSETLNNPSDAQFIRHLRIPLKTFVYDPMWVLNNMNGLPSLELLSLGGSIYTLPRSGASALRLTFYDEEGDRKKLIPIFNMQGNELTSENAMAGIYKFLPDFEREHLYEISKLLHIGIHQQSNFPAYIKIYLNCIELIDESYQGRCEEE